MWKSTLECYFLLQIYYLFYLEPNVVFNKTICQERWIRTTDFDLSNQRFAVKLSLVGATTMILTIVIAVTVLQTTVTRSRPTIRCIKTIKVSLCNVSISEYAHYAELHSANIDCLYLIRNTNYVKICGYCLWKYLYRSCLISIKSKSLITSALPI